LREDDYAILQQIIQDFLSDKQLDFSSIRQVTEEGPPASNKKVRFNTSSRSRSVETLKPTKEDLTSPQFWYDKLKLKDQ
jgi:hypothetical protein